MKKKYNCSACRKKVRPPFTTTFSYSTKTNRITSILCDECDKKFYNNDKEVNDRFFDPYKDESFINYLKRIIKKVGISLLKLDDKL